MKFTASMDGEVTGVRFYEEDGTDDYGNVGNLWSSTGTLLATATFTNESPYGWQQVNFSSPVAIQADTVYVVSYSTNGGYFGYTSGFFTKGGVTNGPLQALSDSVSGGNGVYNFSGAFPDVDGNGMNFWTDVVFTPSSASQDKLVLAATTPETAGKSFSLTVTAQNSSGVTDTGYLGTVHFTSSDVQAGLPANFTFTAADKGTYTFTTVTLKTAGSQSITATDTATSAITGTLSGISVSPASASQFVLSGLPSTTTVGVAQTLTVTAEDPYGNVATGYAGTVKFTSSDTAASLPANYTFATANNGVHTFTLTFGTAGTQSVTVTDTVSTKITGTQGITVAPAAPTNLAASAVSWTQINLTWIGSSSKVSPVT